MSLACPMNTLFATINDWSDYTPAYSCYLWCRISLTHVRLRQTFTNEDHLSSHQKRHEMSLLLPGGITISRSNSLTLGGERGRSGE